MTTTISPSRSAIYRSRVEAAYDRASEALQPLADLEEIASGGSRHADSATRSLAALVRIALVEDLDGEAQPREAARLGRSVDSDLCLLGRIEWLASGGTARADAATIALRSILDLYEAARSAR